MTENLTETPAGTIRRASALLKARAGLATEGPWRPVTGIWDGAEFPAVIRAHGDPQDPKTWLMATGSGGRDQEADAAWAASVHPIVGLAVAEWLETEAHMVGLRGTSDEGQTFHALKVARAYLGEAIP